jgi:uncharacterized damage-inducible protein DinB
MARRNSGDKEYKLRDEFLKAFSQRWAHINAMTTEFANAVPDDSWDASPLEGFAPFSKQLRHVVCVRGVYNDGLRTRRVDFTRKHEFYKGALTRSALVAALAAQHSELLSRLADLPADPYRPQIDFFGNEVSYAQYLYGYVQHEAIHHGQWSIYAASGGYDPPVTWRNQWGLEAGAA